MPDYAIGTSAAAEPRTPEARLLDRILVQGIAWTGVTRWLTQLLSWASTLVVARLLTPSDYGLVGMATVYVGFVHMINDFGLTAAIIHQRDLDEHQLARLGGLALLIGLALFALSVSLAHPVASFFGEDAVRWIVIALSVTFVTRAFQVLPRALLVRELAFRRMAWLDSLEAVALTLATLVLAILGFEYWALVGGAVLGGVAGSILAMAWRPHRLEWPKELRSMASALRFGREMAISQVAWYVYSNADFAILGRVLGKAPLGAYSLGWHVASVPVERVSVLVGRVTPGVFAAVQNDPAALRRYLRLLTEGLALITLPASLGLALVADEFVLLVLGETWRQAILPLRLLAAYAGFRSLMTLVPQILIYTGHSRRNMQFNLLAALVLPASFYLGTHWGTSGVALAWLLVYPIVVIPFCLRHALRIIEMPARSYLHALWPAVTGTLAMGTAVLAARLVTPDGWPAALSFAVQVLSGIAAYAAVVLPGHAPRLRALWALVREVRE